jgi:hypothetical protein
MVGGLVKVVKNNVAPHIISTTTMVRYLVGQKENKPTVNRRMLALLRCRLTSRPYLNFLVFPLRFLHFAFASCILTDDC